MSEALGADPENGWGNARWQGSDPAWPAVAARCLVGHRARSGSFNTCRIDHACARWQACARFDAANAGAETAKKRLEFERHPAGEPFAASGASSFLCVQGVLRGLSPATQLSDGAAGRDGEIAAGGAFAIAHLALVFRGLRQCVDPCQRVG